MKILSRTHSRAPYPRRVLAAASLHHRQLGFTDNTVANDRNSTKVEARSRLIRKRRFRLQRDTKSPSQRRQLLHSWWMKKGRRARARRVESTKDLCCCRRVLLWRAESRHRVKLKREYDPWCAADRDTFDSESRREGIEKSSEALFFLFRFSYSFLSSSVSEFSCRILVVIFTGVCDWWWRLEWSRLPSGTVNQEVCVTSSFSDFISSSPQSYAFLLLWFRVLSFL